MTDVTTSDPTLITGAETTSPEQVTRTGTISEVVNEIGDLRNRTRLLRSDVAQTDQQVSELHHRAVHVQLEAKARELAKRSPSDLLDDLAGKGFSWRDIAALAGVSVPAVRRWRHGEPPTAKRRLAIARLLALVEILREDHLVFEVASWLEMPLAVGAPVTALDLAVAGRYEDVVDVAAQQATGEEVLDRWHPDWRERYSSDFEVFEAADGELGTRPVKRESS